MPGGTRRYFGTWHKYPEGAARIQETWPLKLICEAILWGRELGDSGKTPHIQFSVFLKKRTTYQSFRKQFCKAFRGTNAKDAFIRPVYIKSTMEEAANYCRKEGDFDDWGLWPTDLEQEEDEEDEYETHFKAAKEGRFEDIPIRFYAKHAFALNSYRKVMDERANAKKPKPDELTKPCGVWIWGKPGTGKTTAITQSGLPYYMKTHDDWWPDYNDEPLILLDDIHPKETHMTDLKIWADSYAFRAKNKHEPRPKLIRPKCLVVTSNHAIDSFVQDIWKESDGQALKRRFIEIQAEEGMPIDIEEVRKLIK